jgi:hypothetical protein
LEWPVAQREYTRFYGFANRQRRSFTIAAARRHAKFSLGSRWGSNEEQHFEVCRANA